MTLSTPDRGLAVVDALPEGVVTLDAAGRVLTCNPSAAAMLDAPPHEIVGSMIGLGPMVSEDGTPIPEPDLAWNQTLRDGRPVRSAPAGVPSRDGSTRWIRVNSAPIDEVFERGRAAVVVSFLEVTDGYRLRMEAEHRATHDPLTGLANRVLFERELGRKIGETDRADHQLAVLFLDLDDFKVINDSLGHQEGDRLLRVAAKRLAHAVRHGDVLARFAGDEFVVAAHVASFAVAEAIAERMRSVLGHPVRLGEHEHVLRASIGIAMADGVDEDVADLLRNADSAMYRAKRTGRGVALFDDRMRVAAIERLTLESGLRRALAEGHLELHYQPVVDLTTTAWTSVEALVRWRDPALGLIAPGRFIPVAEDSGLILEVGAWVLEEACSQLAGWQRSGDAPERGIAVNVSLRQLMSRDFPQQVQRVLQMTGIDPGLLGLEITESVLMDGGDYAEDCVTELRGLGVRLILDDFGTGLSSLSRLQELPLDVLKIDQSFIAHLGTDCPSRAIVKAILEMGHALRLEVVAEGVETQAQLDDLRELAPAGLSCHAQGFLLARPTLAHEYVLQARGGELLAAR